MILFKSTPDKGKPSITINGSLDALKEEPPRILISEPEPGAPLVVMFTPETRPLIKFSAVTMLPFVISLAVIASTEPVASFTVVVPYPTTIISSSCSNASSSSTTKLRFVPITTSLSA